MSKELPTRAYDEMPNGELADGLCVLAKVIGAGSDIYRDDAIALLMAASCRLKGHPQPSSGTVMKELLATLERALEYMRTLRWGLDDVLPTDCPVPDDGGVMNEIISAIRKAKGDTK